MNNSRAYRRANAINMAVSNEDRRLLNISNSFQTLEKHAEHYLYIHGKAYPAFSRNEVIERLEEFVKAGALMEEGPLKKKIFEAARALCDKDKPAAEGGEKIRTSITTVGIPTANRPVELDRALSSLVLNLKKYGRTPRIVIADDSDKDDLAANAGTLEKHRKDYGGKVIHLDLASRRKMAEEISAESGAPLQAAVLALCGSDDSPIRTGALRNSMMLLSAGTKILFADDDIISEPRVRKDSSCSGDGKIGKLFLTSGYSNGFFYFDSHDEAVGHFPKIEADCLLAHESMLGRPALSLIAALKNESDLAFDDKPGNFSDPLLKTLEGMTGALKIAATSTGFVGDSWSRGHYFSAITRRDVPHSLCGRSEQEYLRNKKTPYIARCEKDFTLYKGRICASGYLGADAEGLLPPFAPLYRAQDGVFGYLMDSCFPGYVSGQIPILVEHRRPSPREQMTDEVRHITNIAAVTVNAMNISDKAKDLAEKGEELMATSGLPMEEFEAAIRYQCWQSMKGLMGYLKQLKACYAELPDYWHRDKDEAIERIKLAGNDIGRLPLFSDVPGWDPTSRKTWELFADWLRKFGGILAHWERMWDGAKKMR